jgi:predicted acyltransferase (DUF342 family)
MAVIFEQLIKSKKQVLFVTQHIHQPVDTKVLELQAAKDILGEVFGAESEDVDEMIRAKIGELKGLH